ncbi:extracellular solute-binding protein [Streptomyces spiramenti]|uniref:Extracellular solute-binding protein n=1 Tax=Streptomyces spiramenti TaxID=2720606 RepID=A0ABX1AMJ3_9ACTN|nr:extracellular solute-binding protein [Streptomyces spiramenti]NJP67480.1 extracellular solute-binding protein [Streptomyces spiramenti]
MRTTPRTRMTRRAAVGTAAMMLAVTACSSGGDSDGGDDSGKITLTVGVFGQFGLEEAGLYEEYMELNDNIVIEQTSVQKSEDYYPALLTRLPTGSGLMDIQAIEVANVYEVTNELSQYFVDFNDYDVDTGHFLDFKLAQATNADGKVVGLGTDIGPMGICYRTDHFEAAGLPTDRDEVAALWADDWQAYIDTGKEFVKSDVDAAWVDVAGGVFNAVVNTYEERFYDTSGEVVYQESEAVQTAWDLAMDAAESGITAKQKQFEPEWDRAIANGDFATVSCPAWMLGYIQDKADEAGEGLWDFAHAPSPGNWGGAFLSVTDASEHKEEAAKLAAWLTAPEQQARFFAERGSFPSSAEAVQAPEVADATHEYFQDAPIGQLFTEAAEGIPTLVLGPRDQVIQEQIANGLLAADTQGLSSEEAWESTVSSIENALAD